MTTQSIKLTILTLCSMQVAATACLGAEPKCEDSKSIGRDSGQAKPNPRAARPYVHSGIVHSHKSEWNAAIDDLTKAISIDAKSQIAYAARGVANAEIGKYQDAIDDITTALALGPADAQMFYNRGCTYNDLGQYQNAIEDMTKVISLQPEDSDAYANRAYACGRLGLLQKQIDDLTVAIRLKPTAQRYAQRAWAYSAMKNYRSAIDDSTKAISLDPADRDSYAQRGLAYCAMKLSREAIDSFTQAIKLDPNNARLYVDRGTAYMDLKQYKEAVEDLTEAVSLDPKDADAQHLRSVALASLKHGDRSEPAEPADSLIEVSYPVVVPAARKDADLAAIDRVSAEYRKAALDIRSRHIARLKAQGVTIEQVREQVLIREREFGPADARMMSQYAGLAQIYQAAGRPADAEPLYRRVVEFQEKTNALPARIIVSVLADYSDVLMDLKKYSQAEAVLQKSTAVSQQNLSANPALREDLGNAYFLLARVSRSRGDDDMAVTYYQKALAVQLSN